MDIRWLCEVERMFLTCVHKKRDFFWIGEKEEKMVYIMCAWCTVIFYVCLIYGIWTVVRVYR